MKAWLQSLAPRERLIVTVGGTVLALVVVYLAVVEPMAQAYAEREARVAALEREIEWMRDAAAEVRALGGAAAAEDDGSQRPPYLAADRAVREAGLPRPSRLEPVGSRGARMEIDEVAFDRLVQVLVRLHARDGLRVERASFERVGPGLVDASLDLERPE
ncbi:MAG: type II secretion system protein GspM [Halofilum sp. (in: g-proteobacteria)]|nr:type II secretion system protein GspM [Halofilum sp. (in: g-proteobacteria)]